MSQPIWKKKDWMFDSKFRLGELSNAMRVDEIADEVAQKSIPELFNRTMEDELRASFAIENVDLSVPSLRKAISEETVHWSYGFPLNVLRETSVETRAVKAAVFMREIKLSHTTIKGGQALLFPDMVDEERPALTVPKSSYKTFFVEYRDHPESVYDENGKSVYDAPEAEKVPGLMDDFLKWWDKKRRNYPVAIASALAHLYFETIHPFADGNGRIGRLIAEKAWLDTKGVYSGASVFLDADRNTYYEKLARAQDGDIHGWIEHMTNVQREAMVMARKRIFGLETIKEFLGDTILTDAERELIRELVFGKEGKTWTKFQATQYLDDGDFSSFAWDRLHQLGVLCRGKLTYLDFPQAYTQKIRKNGPKP